MKQSGIAGTQYVLGPADLEVVLAMTRTGTLAAAGERLRVDASTVFRSIQRIERGLGRPLFERSRSGYAASELAQALAEQGEHVESALEAARSATQARPEQVSGHVRITTTDAVLHGLVAPALAGLSARHPLLAYELHTGNELASLTRRDADIAVRATRRPPQHLVGRHLGPIRVALYVAKKGALKRRAEAAPGEADWIAPDDALPEHPSVVWRKRHFPKVVPRYRVGSILSVMELVAGGLGVGILPVFLAGRRSDLAQLGDVVEEAQTELWLLTHPESRHLRRVSTVYGHLAAVMSLA
ncbi:MAG TPA: LysR family transcriptional regulator [Caldimonas sp.]|jgi:DNA-binding transcriptional LysR family regulator|nr:LysR family transcriptional regulator [Caldimonas sp.]HEX2542464.1 LysR family transcriptional regulator [Caldimonas sp.]